MTVSGLVIIRIVTCLKWYCVYVELLLGILRFNNPRQPSAEPQQRFLETNRWNKYILVVVDYLFKWVKSYAFPNQKASAAIAGEAIVKDWI